jgi:RimJ/RimL family protein N-acetyltransferase
LPKLPAAHALVVVRADGCLIPDHEERPMTKSLVATPSFRRLALSERGSMLPKHFLRLDAEDRRLRFGGHTGEEHIRAYCARLDRHPGSVVLGCFLAGELRAVGELKPIRGAWLPAAELAVLVERPFRGHGLGTELCRRLVVRARNRFVARVHMLCLLDNRPVQRIARGLGGALSFHQGEAEAELRPPWPDPLSALEAWSDEPGASLERAPTPAPAAASGG